MKHRIKATCRDKRGRVLSVGYNSYTKTHPLQYHFASIAGMKERIYLHAEIDALLKAGKHQVHSMFIERYGTNDRPLLAAPCPICMQAIKAYGVKVVSFTV